MTYLLKRFVLLVLVVTVVHSSGTDALSQLLMNKILDLINSIETKLVASDLVEPIELPLEIPEGRLGEISQSNSRCVEGQTHIVLAHLTSFVESGPKVNLDRADDTKGLDLEVDDDSKRDDVLVGGEVGDVVADGDTKEGERVGVQGEGGEQAESIFCIELAANEL